MYHCRCVLFAMHSVFWSLNSFPSLTNQEILHSHQIIRCSWEKPARSGNNGPVFRSPKDAAGGGCVLTTTWLLLAGVTFQFHTFLPYLLVVLFNSFPVEFLQFRKIDNTESCHRAICLLHKVFQIYLFKKYESQSWLVWLSGLSTGLWTKRLPVRFLGRAHVMFLSLSLKNK